MRITSLYLRRLRSALSTSLEECESFNVIIGKNNAGKSTLLSGINIFFQSLAAGSIINLRPPAGDDIDYYGRLIDQPIEIEVTLSLSDDEQELLVKEMAREVPQVSEAAASIRPGSRVSVVLAVTRSDGLPAPYAFVQEIKLVHNDDHERSLLEVPDLAAAELALSAQEISRTQQDIEVIERIQKGLDSDDWRRLKSSGSLPFRFVGTQRDSPSGTVRHAVEQIAEASNSHDEFNSNIDQQIATWQRRVDEVKNSTLATGIRTFGGEQSTVPAYALNLLDRIRSLNVLYLRERREPIGRAEANRLLELKVRRGGAERLQAIQSTVAALLGVKIDAFQRDSRRGARDEAEMDVDDFLAQANGAGIREALRIVLDVEFDKPAVLLVEEPEIHLHPALETSLMEYLKRISPEVQVFLSTHSTNFLDTAEMKNVYLVSRIDGRTQTDRLSFQDAESEIPRELGIRLSSLFMFDRLLFVEGPTDEAVLRELASKLGINLSQANVGFITMGGARNFAYFAAEATLRFLAHRQVELLFIIDRDERDSAAIGRLESLAGEHAVVHVLERRELENYLLAPAAVGRFIREKRRLSGENEDGPAREEIAAHLNDQADLLKDLAIRKRVEATICYPAYPKRVGSEQTEEAEAAVRESLETLARDIGERAANVEECFSKVRAEVDHAWSSARLWLVPGSILLDAVCSQHGVRYHKDHGDGRRLAALTNANEVPAELVNLLRQITLQ